jgi:hypothetical protein
MRMKGNNIFWSEENAEDMVVLRCFHARSQLLGGRRFLADPPKATQVRHPVTPAAT